MVGAPTFRVFRLFWTLLAMACPPRAVGMPTPRELAAQVLDQVFPRGQRDKAPCPKTGKKGLRAIAWQELCSGSLPVGGAGSPHHGEHLLAQRAQCAIHRHRRHLFPSGKTPASFAGINTKVWSFNINALPQFFWRNFCTLQRPQTST
jgi:hypothetical protein